MIRVTKWVDTEVEVTVNVSLEDIVVELRAGVDDQDTRQQVLAASSNCLQFLQAIPDEMVEQFSDEACKIICRHLRAQAMRYDREQLSLPSAGEEATCTTPAAP